MSKFSSGASLLSSVDLHNESTVREHRYGQLFQTVDGRVFRYTKAGATALVSGTLQQSAAESTNFDQMAVQAAVVVDATTIPVTLGSTATTANLFDYGILAVDNTAAKRQVFAILAHDVTAASGTCNFTVEEPVAVALTTSETVTVRKNPYDAVIIQPTSHTGVAVGGAVKAVTLSTYCFLQVGGLGFCLSDATVTAATTMGLSPSVTTAGCVTKHVNQDQYVGRSVVAINVSAKAMPVLWQLG